MSVAICFSGYSLDSESARELEMAVLMIW